MALSPSSVSCARCRPLECRSSCNPAASTISLCKALNIARALEGEPERNPGSAVWPRANKCHSDPGPSSPCVNAM
ncbi:hypothetical protein NQZ68_027401 [Dissostichus eleginoides]|nr:hypothetical protein NQZ68_027401 [Dissostichus eleginoides]